MLKLDVSLKVRLISEVLTCSVFVCRLDIGGNENASGDTPMFSC